MLYMSIHKLFSAFSEGRVGMGIGDNFGYSQAITGLNSAQFSNYQNNDQRLALATDPPFGLNSSGINPYSAFKQDQNLELGNVNNQLNEKIYDTMQESRDIMAKQRSQQHCCFYYG
jgi:hypothetical protein